MNGLNPVVKEHIQTLNNSLCAREQEPSSKEMKVVQDDEEDDWETQVLNTSIANINLLPPVENDGGAYDMSEYRQLAGNDQSNSSSAAISNAVDPALILCLENPRERLRLLKFEDQIIRFIRNPRETQTTFPPLSSYHRMIIHRLAQRCFLTHQTSDMTPPSQTNAAYDSNGLRVVTLFKTPKTAIPFLLLIDIPCDQQQNRGTSTPAPKIMIRKRGSLAESLRNGSYLSGDGSKDSKNSRTIQDREKAYAEARARIFGDELSLNVAESSSVLSIEDSVQGRNRNHLHANGPDGTKGFGGGRGKTESVRMKGKCSQIQNGIPLVKRDAHEEIPAPKGGRGHGKTFVSDGQDPNSAQNWKESRVLWRNREEELNDPDFTRNHDFIPSNFQTRSGNEDMSLQSGRYASTLYYGAPRSEYYDMAVHGYHHNYQVSGHPNAAIPAHRVHGEFAYPANAPRNLTAAESNQSRYGHTANGPEDNLYHQRKQGSSMSTTTSTRGQRLNGDYNEEFPPLGR